MTENPLLSSRRQVEDADAVMRQTSSSAPEAGRFAPYPVWAAMRVLTTIGAGMFTLWLGSAIVALLSAVSGGKADMLPMWIGIAGVIMGGSGNGFRPGENVPLFGEIIGRMLASKHCPACGQSIFDHTPKSGYAPEAMTYSWWPSRHCTNCGHDMNLRTAP
jgi:hypothetical protein